MSGDRPRIVGRGWLVLVVAILTACTASPAALPTTAASPTTPPPASVPPSGVPPATVQPPSPSPSLIDLPHDYKGDWSGRKVAGTIKYCGSARQPYWGLDVVSNTGDRAFVAFDIPPGSTEPVPAQLVTPFVVPQWNSYVEGTGAYVPGDPPHFQLDIGDGSYTIKLEVGSFCAHP